MLHWQVYHQLHHWSLGLLSKLCSYQASNNLNSVKEFCLMLSFFYMKEIMVFNISSTTTPQMCNHITWFDLYNRSHFYISFNIYLQNLTCTDLIQLLGRIKWILRDLQINRTPSSVFHSWEHYSVFSYIYLRKAGWEERIYIRSGKNNIAMSFRTVHFPSLEMTICWSSGKWVGTTNEIYDVAAVRSRGRFSYERE
jgi:hypothetical protein